MNNVDFSLVDMGKRIETKRKEKNLTQEGLAELCGVTPQFVSYAESGSRAMRPENLLKVANALQVSADYLLTGEMNSQDYEILSKKLSQLSSSQLKLIEAIVNDCISLNKTNQKKST